MTVDDLSPEGQPDLPAALVLGEADDVDRRLEQVGKDVEVAAQRLRS